MFNTSGDGYRSGPGSKHLKSEACLESSYPQNRWVLSAILPGYCGQDRPGYQRYHQENLHIVRIFLKHWNPTIGKAGRNTVNTRSNPWQVMEFMGFGATKAPKGPAERFWCEIPFGPPKSGICSPVGSMC